MYSDTLLVDLNKIKRNVIIGLYFRGGERVRGRAGREGEGRREGGWEGREGGRGGRGERD